MSIFRINLASVVLKLWYSESVGGRFFYTMIVKLENKQESFRDKICSLGVVPKEKYAIH